jgi:hypothetical protein
MMGSDVRGIDFLCSLREVLRTVMHSLAAIFEGKHRFFAEKEYFCRVF